MEDLLKKILSKKTDSMFEALYENVEEEGRVLTDEFKEGLKRYEKKKEKQKDMISQKLNKIYKKDLKEIEEIEELITKYKETIYSENGYYIKKYYIQGLKEGAIMMADAFKSK